MSLNNLELPKTHFKTIFFFQFLVGGDPPSTLADIGSHYLVCSYLPPVLGTSNKMVTTYVQEN